MPSEALIGGAGAGPAAVKDVTTATFMTEVVDGSFEAPVIVDFWAPGGDGSNASPIIPSTAARQTSCRLASCASCTLTFA